MSRGPQSIAELGERLDFEVSDRSRGANGYFHGHYAGFRVYSLELNFYGPPGFAYVRGLGFPFWFLTLIFAILPALEARRIVRRRRGSRVGLCGVCGYDLRASPERCPECGTAVGAAGE